MSNYCGHHPLLVFVYRNNVILESLQIFLFTGYFFPFDFFNSFVIIPAFLLIFMRLLRILTYTIQIVLSALGVSLVCVLTQDFGDFIQRHCNKIVRNRS